MGIDISDRSPTDNPAGFPYKLIMEACTPGVDTTSFAEIFEEHTVVKRLTHVQEVDMHRVS